METPVPLIALHTRCRSCSHRSSSSAPALGLLVVGTLQSYLAPDVTPLSNSMMEKSLLIF